jgi:hypothetical protein
MGGGHSCEWKCNLCKSDKTYKGSFTRVNNYIFHEGVKGVYVCAHTRNLKGKDAFEKEYNDAQNLKDQRRKIGMGSTRHPHLGSGDEPRIVHEAVNRRVVHLEQEISKPTTATKDGRLLKMLINQGSEEVESRVARSIFSCGIPFNVVQSPYW